MRDRIFLWLSVVFLSTLAFLSQTFLSFVVSPAASVIGAAKRSVSAFATFVLGKFGDSRLGLHLLNYKSPKPAAAIRRQRAEQPQMTSGWRLCPSI